MGRSTETIIDQVEKIFQCEKHEAELGVVDAMERMLINMVKNWPTFGDYLFSFIYDHTESLKKYESYDKVPFESIWKCITKSFKQNNMKGIGTINKNANTPLAVYHEKSKHFDKLCFNESRESVFLFALGLRMTTDQVSELLTKMLLQSDFDPKDPKEVIIYWSLKSRNDQDSPYTLMLKWEKEYERIRKGISQYEINRYEKNDTDIIFKNQLLNIKDDTMFGNYLRTLVYNNNINRCRGKQRTIQEVFKGFVMDIQRINKLVQEDEYVYLGYEKLANWLVLYRREISEKYQGPILPDDVLKTLFSTGIGNRIISFKKDYINDRINGNVTISRKDILIAKAVVYFHEIKMDKEEGREYELSKNMLWVDFSKDVDGYFELCRMQPFYLRNPFEYFLVICLLQNEPLDYFMANWERALTWRREVNGR